MKIGGTGGSPNVNPKDRRLEAHDFVENGSTPEELQSAIQHAAQGSRDLTPQSSDPLLSELVTPPGVQAHERLSEREMQVFLMLARGHGRLQVAKMLSMSAKTVSTHRKRVMEKMQLATNSDLTYYAFKHQLLD